MANDGKLVWMDLEMTGLNPKRERIIEIATIITDAQLNIVAEGPELVIYQPEDVLGRMDEWNRTHHGDSGLTERVRMSKTSEEEAEEDTLRFISRFCNIHTSPLCGNSIHQDRRFLTRYMPQLNNYLHYRNLDVSSVKELVKRWYPDIASKLPRKQTSHRAMDDIRASIDELRYYREHVFR